MSIVALEPMFGVRPHVPALCGERDANPPAVRRRGRRKLACQTCGGKIPDGSELVCMSCHGVAPDKAHLVSRHALPPLEYDRRQGDVRAKQAEADSRKSARLTKKERRALMRDARAGEHDAAAVAEFLGRAEAITNH